MPTSHCRGRMFQPASLTLTQGPTLRVAVLCWECPLLENSKSIKEDLTVKGTSSLLSSQLSARSLKSPLHSPNQQKNQTTKHNQPLCSHQLTDGAAWQGNFFPAIWLDQVMTSRFQNKFPLDFCATCLYIRQLWNQNLKILRQDRYLRYS